MKIRKHQGNKTYKITWSQRIPKRGGKSERVVAGGGFILPRVVYTTGQNPTATLNAFLFGRDRTNITARIEESAAQCYIVGTQTGRRSRHTAAMQTLAYVVALSTSLVFGGAR